MPVQRDHDGMVAGEFAALGELLQGFGIHFLLAIRGSEPDIGQRIGGILLNGAAALVDGSVVIFRVVFNLRTHGIEQRGNRVEFECAGVFLERLRQAIAHEAIMAVPEMRSGIIGAECQGLLKFPLRGIEIPVVTEGHVAENGVGFGKLGIKLERARCSIACLGLGFAG